MQNSFVQFVLRQFANKAAAAISHGVIFVVLFGTAWLAKQCPQIAGMCDPQAIATWSWPLIILGVHFLTVHQSILDKATSAKLIADMQATPPVIPVERAEAVK